MKLYNKTKIPDDILSPLLVAAGRAVGTRTTAVVVKVTQAQWYAGCKGVAINATQVARWHLEGKSRRKDGSYKEGYIDTDGGYIKLTLPRWRFGYDALDLAQTVYRVAIHEWQHIKDFQDFVWYNPAERRRRHDNRPWEKAAIAATSKATKRIKPTHQDFIINLAIALEESA